MVSPQDIKNLAKKYFPLVQDVRRHLHRNPELSFQEFETSAFICSKLKEAGIEFTTGHVKTGIIALVRGKNPAKKTILLRGDMDALPIKEENNVEYRSTREGLMHACGHDAHSASVLGAALILNEIRHQFEGTVKIMFQPGEELLPGGANLMIKEGVLKDPEVENAIALHVFPSMEAGKAGFRPGMYMASTDELYLTVNGKGGHAAMPSDYINPLIVASEIILEINDHFMTEDGKKGTPAEKIPTVVAFGKIEGRGATNVIPDKVEIAGTFRTMDENWRASVHKQLQQIVNSISERFNVRSVLRIEHGYPFLVNDETFTGTCIAAAGKYLGEENVEELQLRMTAEDFSFISQEVPSCFFRLGTGNKQRGITSGVHTPTFDIDESALETGSGLLAWLAIAGLSQSR